MFKMSQYLIPYNILPSIGFIITEEVDDLSGREEGVLIQRGK